MGLITAEQGVFKCFFFLLTLIHCLGDNRSHSTHHEDVYFVDVDVVVDADVDRAQTCSNFWIWPMDRSNLHSSFLGIPAP